MSGLRVMVPPVEPSSWAERPEVRAYRQRVRQRLLAEELERRVAARSAGPVVATRPEPDDRFAPCPPNPWGEVRLPSPWRFEDRPARLSPGDYAPIPASPWDQLRRVEPGPEPRPAHEPVPRRVASDLAYVPFKPSPWDR
jgi:hypothetical protein